MNSSQDNDAKPTQESPDLPIEQPKDEGTPMETETPVSTGAKRNTPTYLLFFLTLVLIIASVGGTSFWLWTKFRYAFTSQQQEINVLRQNLSDKASRQQIEDLARQSQMLASEQKEQSQLIKSLGQTIDQSQALIQRNRRGWSIAEVEYLMRIARFRLDLLQDTHGAQSALLLADQRLARLGDLSLLPVRKALTAEIQSLRDFHAPDKTGVLLQIDQIMSTIVLPTPFANTLLSKPAAQTNPVGETQHTTDFKGLLMSIWQSISDHISIRHYPQQINDLADITTQAHAAQAIYLNLQNARIAVLTGNNAIFHQSIQRVLNTITTTRKDTPLNTGLEKTLKQLDMTDIAPALPTIGNALTLLQKIAQASSVSQQKGGHS